MREAGKTAAPLTVEEYIQSELVAERRHEYVNGQLFEMPGEKDINNEIALYLFMFFFQKLKERGYQVYVNDVKVAIPGGEKYYYPDVFVTQEERTEGNRYIKYSPELIAEVISPSSHVTDRVDKYIAYTTISSLKYYLIVEPETVYVTLHFKNAEGRWEVATYVRRTDAVSLPALNAELPLSEVYR